MLFFNLTFNSTLFKSPITEDVMVLQCNFIKIKVSQNLPAAAIFLTEQQRSLIFTGNVYQYCSCDTGSIIYYTQISGKTTITNDCFAQCSSLTATYQAAGNDLILIPFKISDISINTAFDAFEIFSVNIFSPASFTGINATNCGDALISIEAGTFKYSNFYIIYGLEFDFMKYEIHRNFFYFTNESSTITLSLSLRVIFTECYFDMDRFSKNFIQNPDLGYISFINCTFSCNYSAIIDEYVSITDAYISFIPPHNINTSLCAQFNQTLTFDITNNQTRGYYSFTSLRVDVHDCCFVDVETNIEKAGGIACYDAFLTSSLVRTTFIQCSSIHSGALYLNCYLETFEHCCFIECYGITNLAFQIEGIYYPEFNCNFISGTFSNKESLYFTYFSYCNLPKISQSNFSNIISYSEGICFDIVSRRQLFIYSLFSNLTLRTYIDTWGSINNTFFINSVALTDAFIQADAINNCSFFNIVLKNSSTTSFDGVITNCYTDSELIAAIFGQNFSVIDAKPFPYSLAFQCYVFHEPKSNHLDLIWIILIPCLGVLLITMIIIMIYSLRMRRIARRELSKSEMRQKILSDFG